MENTDDDHGGLVLIIPGDVLIQILVWLPVISLLRFKSVCKSWRALIESSFFIHLHAAATITTTSCSSSNKFGTFILQTSPSYDTKESRIFMLTPSRRRSGGGGEVFEVEDLGVPPLYKSDPAARWKMVGSCNGLICSKLRRGVVSLWNPATRQFRLLPKSSLTLEEEKEKDESGWILAPDVFGFGFDVKTKDYKVVQIRPMFLHGKLVEFRVEVYSLSTNSWRGINSLPASAISDQGSSFHMDSDGVYLNGSFFFMGTYGSGIEHTLRHWILSFDFTKEIFTPIKLLFPDEQFDSNSILFLILTYFGADKIKIAFLVESNPSSRDEGRTDVVYDTWVLNNNNEHEQEKEESYYWTKLQHSIRISRREGSWIIPRAISDDGEFALIETRGDDWNLGLVNDDDDDGEFALIETRGGDNDAKDLKLQLQLFNLVTKEGKTFFVFPTGMELLRADIYKPTLVSVISGGGNGNGTAGSS